MADMELQVANLKGQLAEMPINMRLFSLSMRSLYADKAVGTSTEAARRFRQLRDDTRNDAMVYLKCILPVSTKFVMSIKDYFENYEALSFDEWKEMLPEIREDARNYKEIAQTVVGMHEEMMVPLKKRQDEASTIMKEFQNLQQVYEKKREELEASANAKKGWAIGLAFIPFVNVIASPVLAALANKDMAEAVAKLEESKVHEAAALVVSTALIPALSNFIEGLEKAAGFFQVMETDLQSFEEKAGQSLESPSESRKKLHFKKMSQAAEDMKSLCQRFCAVIPAVRTDFAAIPHEGTDENYVDKWLKKQLEDIQKKKFSGVQKFLLKILDK